MPEWCPHLCAIPAKAAQRRLLPTIARGELMQQWCCKGNFTNGRTWPHGWWMSKTVLGFKIKQISSKTNTSQSARGVWQHGGILEPALIKFQLTPFSVFFWMWSLYVQKDLKLILTGWSETVGANYFFFYHVSLRSQQGVLFALRGRQIENTRTIPADCTRLTQSSSRLLWTIKLLLDSSADKRDIGLERPSKDYFELDSRRIAMFLAQVNGAVGKVQKDRQLKALKWHWVFLERKEKISWISKGSQNDVKSRADKC